MPEIAAREDAPAPGADPAGRGRETLRWESHLLYIAVLGVGYYALLGSTATADWQWVLQAILAPFAIVAVLLRARMPYALPLLGILAMVAHTNIVFSVGMMSLSVRRRGARVWLTGALGFAVLLMTTFRHVLDEPLSWIAQIVPMIATFFVVLPMLVGRYIRRSREREAAAVARAVRAEVEQEIAAARAVHTERERIAREMHDSLGHLLALVTMQAGALEMGAKDPEVAAAAAGIRESARSGLVELRAVVRALGQDARLDPALGLSAVPGLVEASREAGAAVTLTDEVDDPAALPSSTGRVVYQVVQEALTNAHRHAPGAAVSVVLSGAPEAGLTVAVGNPLAPGGERGAGTGLDALRGRVEVLGGELSSRAMNGRFELRARLPWEAAA